MLLTTSTAPLRPGHSKSDTLWPVQGVRAAKVTHLTHQRKAWLLVVPPSSEDATDIDGWALHGTESKLASMGRDARARLNSRDKHTSITEETQCLDGERERGCERGA